MGHLKLLIVDDVEDNRLVLRAICRNVEGFEIQEAQDGMEAVEMAERWQPHIVLMDVMMPRMNGLDATKIIKKMHPDTVVMAITAIADSQMEQNMSGAGVAAYIHKPIDKELIRFKLQSFGALLRSKEGQYKKLSEKAALNPFNADIRHFKTSFEIKDSEGMMDFGMWILNRCEEKGVSCSKTDSALEFFYELMRYGTRDGKEFGIVIEESFEEIYVTMSFREPLTLNTKAAHLLEDLGADAVVDDAGASVRLPLPNVPKQTVPAAVVKPIPAVANPEPKIEVAETKPVPAATVVEEPETESAKEKRTLQSEEQQLLRQSFVNKTSAVDYVREIGGDVLDEIRDLGSLDEEWQEKIQRFEDEPTVENLRHFADDVLAVYVRALNNLFEFTALAYALSSLGAFFKEHGEAIVEDPKKIKTLVVLTEHLGNDLTSWREHVFSLQDTADIHYLDSSFFSSCMQIEGIIADKEIESEDDNDMEFF